MESVTTSQETLSVGQGLVELCQQGQFAEATEKFYADHVVSIEGLKIEGVDMRMEGLAAVRAKGDWFRANHDVHEIRVQGPFIAENSDSFLVHFHLDVTGHADKQRRTTIEVGLYTVEDGKIVEERYFNLVEPTDGRN